LAPTIQYLPGAVERENERGPRYIELVERLKDKGVRHSSIQSEEGGRFYHYQNRYLILEASQGEVVEEPSNYHWMTLWQLNTLMLYGNHLNIEARSLLSCLTLGCNG
jgi:oxidase EvaA